VNCGHDMWPSVMRRRYSGTEPRMAAKASRVTNRFFAARHYRVA